MNYPLYNVSVPLRGKGRDQRSVYQVTVFKHLEFPSPCGEKVGINVVGFYDEDEDN